jgi:hypothetical protein
MKGFQDAMGSVGSALYSGGFGSANIASMPVAAPVQANNSAQQAQDASRQKLIDSIQSVFDLLQSSLDKIYGSLTSAAQTGMDFIDKSLSVAELTG